MMISAARLLLSALFNGRTLPSSPTRTTGCCPGQAISRWMLATVRARETRGPRDGPVRALGVGADDPLRGPAPVTMRQRKAVLHIRLDGAQERFLSDVVEEVDLDRLLALESGGHQSVCSVDHAHRAAADENRGQRGVEFRQPGYLADVLSPRPGGNPPNESADGNGHDAREGIPLACRGRWDLRLPQCPPHRMGGRGTCSMCFTPLDSWYISCSCLSRPWSRPRVKRAGPLPHLVPARSGAWAAVGHGYSRIHVDRPLHHYSLDRRKFTPCFDQITSKSIISCTPQSCRYVKFGLRADADRTLRNTGVPAHDADGLIRP